MHVPYVYTVYKDGEYYTSSTWCMEGYVKECRDGTVSNVTPERLAAFNALLKYVNAAEAAFNAG